MVKNLFHSGKRKDGKNVNASDLLGRFFNYNSCWYIRYFRRCWSF